MFSIKKSMYIFIIVPCIILVSIIFIKLFYTANLSINNKEEKVNMTKDEALVLINSKIKIPDGYKLSESFLMELNGRKYYVSPLVYSGPNENIVPKKHIGYAVDIDTKEVLFDREQKSPELVKLDEYNSMKKIKINNIQDAAKNTYIAEDTSARYLSEDDLKGIDKKTLAFVRNEIFARKGYIFNEEPFKSYFSGESWYAGIISNSDSVVLNEYEKANVDLIKKYEGLGSQESTVNNTNKLVNYKNITYNNSKFHYSIAYPSTFNMREYESKDGIRGLNEEGVGLKVWGGNNLSNKTAQSLYNDEMKSKHNIGYNNLNDRSFVVTWEESGYLYYYCMSVGAGSYNGFEISYPKESNNKYTDMIQKIYDSFKVGDLNKSW